MGKHWAPDLQLPGSTATTEFKNPMTFCPGTICIVMAFPSGLITAGRKMKVLLAKEICIQVAVLIGYHLEISRSQ